MTMTNTNYEWVAVKNIGEIYNISSTLLMYHVKFQGIPSQKNCGINYIRSCDIEILKMCIARSRAREQMRKDPKFAYKAALRHRGYQNKKRKAAGLDPLPRLEKDESPQMTPEQIMHHREQKQIEKLKALNVELVFEYNDRIKRGKLIGGNIKSEFKTALFRFVNSAGFKEIASVPFEKVHYDAAELENYIVKIHKSVVL